MQHDLDEGDGNYGEVQKPKPDLKPKPTLKSKPTAADAAIYRCEASNDNGTDEESVKLQVNFPSDERLVSLVALLDLSAASDTLDHSLSAFHKD
nr:hypothetical protein BaRGS_007207 [Batillaria attramentaria]